MKIIREEFEWKEYLFTIPFSSDIKLDIYKVDPKYIQDHWDVSFSGGSNFISDHYIPENEVWLAQAEREILLHEFTEMVVETIFEKYGIDKNDHENEYLDAHYFATIIEGFIRQFFKDKI
jgi:hypothetical protein